MPTIINLTATRRRGLIALALAGVVLIGSRRLIRPAVGGGASLDIASHFNPGLAKFAAPPASGPAPVTFEDKKDNLRLQYPPNWEPRSDNDYVLRLAPVKEKSDRSIMLDVPDLPPHFPGMIRLSLIENGYVGDLKKQHAGLHVDRAADHAIGGGAKARLVETSWKQDGKTYNNLGLLMMRGEHVFILSAQAQATELPATRADFDQVAASLQWTR